MAHLRIGRNDDNLASLFAFSVDDLKEAHNGDVSDSALRRTMDCLALEFGDLSNENAEHIVLDNPVWTKPFIRNDGLYYCFSPATFWYFGIEICESLVAIDANLSIMYEKRKGRYLEEAVEKLFQSISTHVYCGSKWKMPANEEGENDLAAIVGTCCVISEQKAYKLPPRAKRGDLAAIESTVSATIGKGISQAAAFEAVLKVSRDPGTFPTHHRTVNRIDVRAVDAYLMIVVTMFPLGMLSGSIAQWVNAGLLAQPPANVLCMSLPHLMSVFELLKTPARVLRYFAWRLRVERDVSYYGDELDLLSIFFHDRAEEIFQNGDVADEAKKLTKYFLTSDA